MMVECELSVSAGRSLGPVAYPSGKPSMACKTCQGIYMIQMTPILSPHLIALVSQGQRDHSFEAFANL